MTQCLDNVELNAQESNNFRFDIVLFQTFKYSLVELELPDMNLGIIKRQSPLSTIGSNIAGDNIDFGDLICTFIVDEKLNNYRFLYRWMLQLVETSRIKNLPALNEEERNLLSLEKSDLYANGTLFVLTNNSTVVNKINFHSLFPVSLSALKFSTLENYSLTTCTVTFKYHYFEFMA